MIKNKIIILCGGRGKRMGKITKDIPKPMVRIGNSPIIEHKIKYYRSQGINDFIFCTGYKSKILKDYFVINIILAISLIILRNLVLSFLKSLFWFAENIVPIYIKLEYKKKLVLFNSSFLIFQSWLFIDLLCQKKLILNS